MSDSNVIATTSQRLAESRYSAYPALVAPDGGLPPTPATVDRWVERACIDKGRTNMAGCAEYTIGSGSYIDGSGHGPYSHFIVDPECGSDVVDGLGLYRSTNHHGVVDSDWQETDGASDPGDEEPGEEPAPDQGSGWALVAVVGSVAVALERLVAHFGA